ncbi:hypothetical protein ACHAQH_007280 [Verticillium albo-atrum]
MNSTRNPPGNFDDDQLTAGEPVALSEDKFTQTSAAIALRKYFPLRLAVTKYLNDIGPRNTYEETLRLDAELRAAVKVLHQTLQRLSSVPGGPSPGASESLILRFLLHRYISTLHIPFFGSALRETAHAFSRKVVVDMSLKLWYATHSSAAETFGEGDSRGSQDLARLTTNGSGFYRTVAFQAMLLVAAELRAQLREDDGAGFEASLRPDLLAVMEDAKAWSLVCIEAGETNFKSHLLVCVVSAAIEAARRGLDGEQRVGAVVQAAEAALERSLRLLEGVATKDHEKISRGLGDGSQVPATPVDSETDAIVDDWDFMSLLDSIINVVNSLADRTLDRVEQGLSSASPKTLGFEKALKKQQQQQQQKNPSADPPPTAEEAAKFEVADGVHKLETLLCNAIDKNFDIFELYVMRYLICVNPDARPWLRLSHYGAHDFDAPARDGAPTFESVNAVRRSLQGSQRLNVMLHAEKARNAALLAKLRAAVGGKAVGRPARASLGEGDDGVKDEEGASAPFGFLHARGDLADADANTPITTTAAFTLSQLQALRALSTSLTNIMPDLAGEGDATGDDERRKGWRRERVEYVEVATRKHLENVRGLELGKNGEVRDGEWQGEGRKFAKGEVEGLENIAAALGGGSGEASSRKEDEMDES